MYVPNYIPQPIEIVGNVADSAWKTKLAFIRQAQNWLVLSLVVVAAAIWFLKVSAAVIFPIWPSVAALLFFTLTLSLVRVRNRGTAEEQSISFVILPMVMISWAAFGSSLDLVKWPLWAVTFGPVCAWIYGLSCGRDFSFLGQYLLSLLASTVALAVLCNSRFYSAVTAERAMISNAIFLTYYCYDLAATLSRRRPGESLTAAIDIYRDYLNFFGYAVRCWKHWKEHKIWNLPWTT